SRVRTLSVKARTKGMAGGPLWALLLGVNPAASRAGVGAAGIAEAGPGGIGAPPGPARAKTGSKTNKDPRRPWSEKISASGPVVARLSISRTAIPPPAQRSEIEQVRIRERGSDIKEDGFLFAAEMNIKDPIALAAGVGAGQQRGLAFSGNQR